MSSRRLRFILLGAGVAAAMIFLLAVGITSSGGFVYYLTLSEFLEKGAPQGKDFRVSGKVASGTIERLPGGARVRFVMTDGNGTLPVDYEGIIPDTFVDGADVVVQGELGRDGVLKADVLLAKCPSKYEAATDEVVAASADQ